MTTPATVARRHPIRGALYGILLGVGLALLVIGRKIVNLDSVVPIVLLVVGIVIGIAWGMFAPAKKPKGPPPAPRVEVAEDSAVTSTPIIGTAEASDDTAGGSADGSDGTAEGSDDTAGGSADGSVGTAEGSDDDPPASTT